MADKKINLDFYAKVQTDVSSVKEVVKNLKNQLETLELPAGATKNFEKIFTNLEKSIQDFESVASNSITNLADTKKIDAAWKKITGLFSTLGIQIKDLNSISDQVFPREVSDNISKAAKALGEYQAKIEAIKKSQSYTEKSRAKVDADSKAKTATNEWQKQQDILDKKQREYDAKQNAWNQNRAAQYQGQKNQISKITQEIDAQKAKLQEQIEIQKQLRDVGVITKEGAVRESHKRAITSVEADIAGMEKAQKLAKENLELAKKAETQAKKAQTSAKGQETKILKKVDAKDPKAIAATQAKTAAMQAYAQAQSEAATKAQELADIEANLAKAKDRLTTLQGQSAQAEQIGKKAQDIEDEIEALDKTREATKKAAAANAEYEAKLNESKQALEDQKVVVASYETAMNEAKNAANSLGAEMDQMELDQTKIEWEALTKVIKEFTGIDLTAAQGDIQEIARVLEEYKADQIKKAPETIEKLSEAARQAEPKLENMKKASDEVTESITNMIRTERDIENLKGQILDFFSISNAVQIFKDTVHRAFETVKELDAVMTETAVVTDFSIGDMWDKLPEYSDEANKLGTSISSLYEATTLYYQQGLKSQEAMDVGIETMKMARIANMDAAAATEAMTAALRGFNMEINEMSATRINDVYSELAAITAADTSQIATAMSKTASIAASANMEFETTAALLAQIIETTQEAPETAGTAMKTIIARFTEVKQLFDEGMLAGKDSEGEEIDINKIDTALKKVGISLSDFLRGEKGIDDIFLELASKWDTLDLATQRYIATTAAGSRQQSRFLAMMSNYGRTMELVTAANNSAGASQKQFDKTLESLDAKLQRLKNAWSEFTMGLANNDILKGTIDLLTGLLETINKLTDALSGGSGLGKSIINFMTIIGALKGGKALLAGGFGQIGTWMGIEKKQQLPSQKELSAWWRAQKYSQEDIAAGKQSGFHGFMSGVFGTREKIAMPDRGFNDSYLRELAKEQRAEARYQQRQAGMYLGMSTDKENIENISINEKFAQNAIDAAGTANSAAKAYENLAIKIKAAKEITPELKAEMDALGITEEQITQYANIQTISFQRMGTAALLTGGALGLVANVFDEMGNNNAVEFCQKLSTTLTGMGGILTMLPMLFGGTTLALEGTTLGVKTATGAFKSFGISVWAALAWVGALVAIVLVLVAAFKAIHAASPEGKLEAATEAANDAAEAAENAAQAYEHLASALDSIDGKSAALENLAVGTTEWKNAVQELNGEVLDLIELYPELAKFVDTSNGYLSFTDKEIDGKTVEGVLETYQDNKFKAQSASAAAKLQKQQAQQTVDFENLNYKAKQFTTRDMTASEMGAMIDTADPIAWAGTMFGGMIAKAFGKGPKIEEVDQKLTDELARAIIKGQAEISKNKDEGTTTVKIGENEEYTFENDVYSELLKYSEGLVAADAATKVFTDSLLSNALMTAEVSEEQKSNMMNFLDSEQVNSQVDDMLNIITGNWTKLDERQQYKQGYADIMGYEYDKSKDRFLKDGQEVQISDESIRRQMAGVKVQENLNAKMQNLDKTLNLIDDNAEGLPSIFERMTEKGEGTALTFNDLQQIQSKTDEQLSELYNNKELGLSNIYETKEEFVQFMRNSAKLGQAQMDQATKNLEIINMSDYITEDMNLDIGQTKNVSDLLYEAVVQSGLDKGKELADNLKKGLEEEGEGKKLAEALGMIDSSNIDSIKKLSEYLTDLDYTGTINMDQLEQEIIEATNASKKFTLDNLKEEIGSIQELAKDIKERDKTDVTYTKEERDELVKSGIGKEFFVSTGKDEFTYIGESNDQLVAALQANTAALLGKTEEQLREAAQKSEGWGKLQETDLENYSLLQGIAEGTVKAKDIDPYLLKAAMESAGISTEEFNSSQVDDTGGLSENILNILTNRILSEYTDFGSAAAQMTNQNNLQSYYEDGAAQLAYSSMTGQQILNTSTQIDPATGQPIVNQQSRDIGSQVLESKLAQQEGGRAEVESLINNNEALKEHGDLIKAAVTDAADYEKRMAKLADTIEDNTDALSDTKKGTRDYEKALDKVTDAAKDAFGNDITKEFVEENLDLFKEFAKGSEKAVDGIRKKMMESFKESGKFTEAEFAEIEQAANGLDGLNFDIYGHADASQIFSELAAVIGSAEEAAAVIESLGYSVTWVPDGSTTMIMPDGSTRSIPNYKTIVTDSAGNTAGGRGGGGGGGGGKQEPWENPYDKLYNLTEEINKSIREREQLERRYQRLIDRRIATAAELQRNSQAEIESLKEQAKLQQQMIEGRREMMEEEMEENSDLQKYATINTETGQITIDWELIDSVTDEEEGSEIKEYISKLEEFRDSMHEAQDALEDINDAVWEIKERGREEYMELEDTIKEALVQSYQNEIDKLSEINDSINETNSSLLDAIQKSVDKQRRDRDNQRTEEDLAEKQRRLLYLQQDTSGVNAMEILQLQKEIEEGQEDHTDSLIDQKISELQEQNDDAAKQREQQITLLQAQLENYIKTGQVWQDVYSLVDEGLDKDSGLVRGSRLEELLKTADGFAGMSEISKMEWLNDTNNMIAQALAYLEIGRQVEDIGLEAGTTIQFTDAKGKVLSGTVDEKGNVTTSSGQSYNNVFQGADGKYYAGENIEEPKEAEVETPKTNKTESSTKPSGSKTNTKTDGSPKASPYWTITGSSQKYATEQEAKFALQKLYAQIDASANYQTVTGRVDTASIKKKYQVKYHAYKTGGLADYTGPAWLDGTKSRPEIVLNQQDSRNFVQLRDILSSVLSRGNVHTATENNGDILYDIDINVESIGSDYDVEQVANKVKSLINEDARYRNNNTVSLKR